MLRYIYISPIYKLNPVIQSSIQLINQPPYVMTACIIVKQYRDNTATKGSSITPDQHYIQMWPFGGRGLRPVGK